MLPCKTSLFHRLHQQGECLGSFKDLSPKQQPLYWVHTSFLLLVGWNQRVGWSALVIPVHEAKITGPRSVSFCHKKKFLFKKTLFLLDANCKCLTTNVESLELITDNLYLLLQKVVTTCIVHIHRYLKIFRKYCINFFSAAHILGICASH